jgi:hypothetical protein
MYIVCKGENLVLLSEVEPHLSTHSRVSCLLEEALTLTDILIVFVRVAGLVFWVVTVCGLVGRYQGSRGTYCLHLQ